MTEDLARLQERLGSADEEERRLAVIALADTPDKTAELLDLLFRALGDDSWRVRKDVVAQLAAWPAVDVAVERLVTVLTGDDNVARRNSAVEALWALGQPAVEPLVAALAVGGEHRKFLIDPLAAIGDESVVPVLAACFRDEDENVRAAAAEALGMIGGRDAADALLTHLGRIAQSEQALYERLATLEALDRVRVPVSIDVVVPLVSQSILRSAALRVLGRSQNLHALAHLVSGAEDDAVGVHRSSLVGLVELYAGLSEKKDQEQVIAAVQKFDDSAVQRLVERVGSPRLDVKRAAIALLGWGRWPDALPRLVDALLDEEANDVAAMAIAAYGPSSLEPLIEIARETGDDHKGQLFALFPYIDGAKDNAAVVNMLMAAVKEGDADVTVAAILALGDVGGKAGLATLFHALEAVDDLAVPRAAVAALAKLGAAYHDDVRMLIQARGISGSLGVNLCAVVKAMARSEDRELLLQTLKAPEADLRAAAADALGALGAHADTTQALLFALADESPEARAAAASSLGHLADPGTVDAIVAATGDDEDTVRLAATCALGALRQPTAVRALCALAEGESPAVAVAALESLAQIPGDDTARDELLVRLLSHNDAELAKGAVHALAAHWSEQARAALLHTLEHRQWDVRQCVVEKLATHVASDPEARERLCAHKAKEEDVLVREAIDLALEG